MRRDAWSGCPGRRRRPISFDSRSVRYPPSIAGECRYRSGLPPWSPKLPSRLKTTVSVSFPLKVNSMNSPVALAEYFDHSSLRFRLRAMSESKRVRFDVQPSNQPLGSSCNLRPTCGRQWRNCLGRVVPGTHLGSGGLVGSIARQEWLRNGCFELQSQKLSRAWHRFSVCATAKRSDSSAVCPTISAPTE